MKYNRTIGKSGTADKKAQGKTSTGAQTKAPIGPQARQHKTSSAIRAEARSAPSKIAQGKTGTGAQTMAPIGPQARLHKAIASYSMKNYRRRARVASYTGTCNYL